MKLVIYSPDDAELARLKPLFSGRPDIVTFNGTGPAATATHHLDAIFLTGMHITSWGADPMNANQAKVLASPKEKRALGLPSRFVAGWLLPRTTQDSESGAGIGYARLLLETVKSYNSQNPGNPLLNIGSIPGFLGLDTAFASKIAVYLKQNLSHAQDEWSQGPLMTKISA